jgi:hypothetical protein
MFHPKIAFLRVLLPSPFKGRGAVGRLLIKSLLHHLHSLHLPARRGEPNIITSRTPALRLQGEDMLTFRFIPLPFGIDCFQKEVIPLFERRYFAEMRFVGYRC